jgi:hypothetical protein
MTLQCWPTPTWFPCGPRPRAASSEAGRQHPRAGSGQGLPGLAARGVGVGVPGGGGMSDIEYAVPLEDQLRGLPEDERAQVLAELRCVRCRKLKATPEAWVCPVCIIEVRPPGRADERRASTSPGPGSLALAGIQAEPHLGGHSRCSPLVRPGTQRFPR